MDRLTELRDTVAYLQSELESIHEDAAERSLTPDEQTRFDDGVFVRNAAIAEGIELEKRENAIASVRSGDLTHVESGDSIRDRSVNVIVGDKDPYSERYQREVGTREAALRAIGECREVGGDEKTEMERKLKVSAGDAHMRGFDQYILKHNSETYSRGVLKLINGMGWQMTPEEVAVVRETQNWDEERGLTLTAANGGALIPAHLDPTVLLTNAGTAGNPYRSISRTVSMMTNVWNGVTSAGVTMAWSTEGGDSSDVAPVFQQPAITCAKAHGTVPVTIEAFEDIQGLGGEIARLIQDGKDRLEQTAFTSGSGTGQPKGIVTTIYGLSTLRSAHATNSAFTATDLINAQNALPARFQPNASWIMSLTYLNRVRAMGDTNYFGRSVTLDQAVSETILGKPAYEVSDMSTALSTATNTAAVYGDFSNFVIADRVGLAVEFIPHLLSAGNVLPNGRRGWYAYWRTGSDSVLNTSFVVSTNPGA